MGRYWYIVLALEAVGVFDSPESEPLEESGPEINGETCGVSEVGTRRDVVGAGLADEVVQVLAVTVDVDDVVSHIR